MMLLCMICGMLAGLPAGNARAEGDTIEIGTADAFIALCNEDFEKIRDKKIVLTADIDMTGRNAIAPIGSTAAFNGTFDGQGHAIRNLQIAGTDVCTGLFGHVGTSGSITRLGLDQVTVEGKVNNSYITKMRRNRAFKTPVNTHFLLSTT